MNAMHGHVQHGGMNFNGPFINGNKGNVQFAKMFIYYERFLRRFFGLVVIVAAA